MPENNEIQFGTDGWRGVISDNFTFKNVRRVAQAIADYYNAKSKLPKIAVGYDTRFLSKEYAQAVANVFSANNIDVLLADNATPTPMLSFKVKNHSQAAGVMITASHNPAEYNGIKIKTHTGGAAGVEITKEIERMANAITDVKLEPKAKISKVDFSKEYVYFLRSYVDFKKFKNVKFKVLVDSMHGSGGTFIARVLRGSSIELEFTRADINPSFGGLRPEPVAENLEATMQKMKKEKFDICLVLDGDADRIACVAPGGEFISPQRILGLLALHLSRDRKMTGGLVKTIVGSNIMDNISAKLNLKLYETPVGFKYISNLMETKDILVGGEEAGGMGFKNYIPERDGSMAGLLLLEMMADRKKSFLKILDEVEKEFGKYVYLRDDLRIPNIKVDYEALKKVKSVCNKVVVQVKDYDGVKLMLKDSSWLMFRGSGTEPIMRVYAESRSLKTTKELLAFGRKLILPDAL
ncbi:MAG: phosphoglucomutase/phosphomannomutase family protein [Candidatus Omnitrophica bacterium]|nr:phosphoglucomutase/phosphomannomutase family protein [Candidatus Omnitrophota bacterium]